MQQANKMAAEARGLLAESERLLAEARAMDPSLAPPVPAIETPKAKAPRKAKAKASA